MINNPSGVYAQSNPQSFCHPNSSSFLLFQSTNGQVYASNFQIINSLLKFGDWVLVGGKIEFDDGYVPQSRDSLSVQAFENSLYVFARSFTNSSHLYVSILDPNTMKTTSWQMVGGDSAALLTDATIAYNSFTKLLEAFMVSTDGYLYRSWQTKPTEWSNWDKTGYSGPKSSHAPVVHGMDSNIFNGRLNVFVYGEDGYLHHIWQTTCDKVPNPWGWCTWSTWYQIGGAMPKTLDDMNTLGIGNNLHKGIEIFTVSSDGELFRLWQLDRHKHWRGWEQMTRDVEYVITSLPTVVSNIGWWKVFVLDKSSAVRTIKQTSVFHVEPSSVGFSTRTDVSWIIPIDEASNKDWIAIYNKGSGNEDYLDYMYVGGAQNPLSDPVPNGKTSFMIYLPEGIYDVRYLIDKQYISATQTSLTVTSSSTEEEWVQIFRGIFTGLNLVNVSIETCVKDAENIRDYFEKAFQQFEDRFVYTGLTDLGVAIGLIVKGMKDCGIENTLVSKVEGFVKDLMACIEKEGCVHFVVDLAKRLLVLYENEYEIYGDIKGATNCFKTEAYVQGSYNVGRVIAACIALPR